MAAPPLNSDTPDGFLELLCALPPEISAILLDHAVVTRSQLKSFLYELQVSETLLASGPGSVLSPEDIIAVVRDLDSTFVVEASPQDDYAEIPNGLCEPSQGIDLASPDEDEDTDDGEDTE
jgi:hypothetical protein